MALMDSNMAFMDRKKQISFKYINYISFLAFWVLILLPVISIALTSQLPKQSLSPIETSSRQTPQRLTTYGPVENNVGLWDIAEEIHLNFQESILQTSNSEITIPQIAVALFYKNPEAFINQNINGLLIGSTLKVPDIQQIQKLTKADAFDLFLQHWDVWQGVKSDVVIRKNININKLDLPSSKTEKMTLQTSNKKILSLKSESEDETIEPTKSIISMTSATIAPAVFEDTTPNEHIAQQKIEQNETSIVDEMQNINFHQNIARIINWFQSHLNISDINKNNILGLFNNTSVQIALASLLFILFIVWLSRREESQTFEIRTNPSTDTETSLSDKKPVIHQTSISQDNVLKEENIPLLDIQQSVHFEKKDNTEEIDIFSGNIIPNQIDLDAAILQDKKINKNSSKNILEAAFADNIDSSCNQFVPEKIQTPPKKQSKIIEIQSTDEYLIDSVDEIRFINEETKSAKLNAFLNATQLETLPDEMLSHDFDIIINSEKIDVFIQEFEDVMSELSSHKPEVSRTENNLDKLVQYKLSIHFIKILSEMMQATYLNQFSTTIIDFLEDVLDGKIKMTDDTTNRLIIVINFYSRYIHSVKKQNSGKLEA